MKIRYLLATMAIISAACQSTFAAAQTEQTPAPVSAAVAYQPAQVPTARPAFALGKVWVRDCASTGCAALGYIEAGGKVSISGDAIYTSHPDCQQWQGVEWRGGIGYVCADWLAK